MDILLQKKGRKPLQYAPKDLQPELMSDDDYCIIDGNNEDTVNEGALHKATQELKSNYLSLNKPSNQKQIDLLAKNLIFSGGIFTLAKLNLDDDFLRESALEKSSKEIIENHRKTIEAMQITLGRPEEIKGKLFNRDFSKELVQPVKKAKLKKKKKLSKFIYDTPQTEEGPEYLKTTHKKARFFNSYKPNKSQKGKKKRPGKRARDSYRKNRPNS